MIKVVIACTVILLAIVGTGVVSVAVSVQAINNSQHNWCEALDLLTRHPVPKPANPNQNKSREVNYQFYLTLLDLEQHFHC